MKSIFKIISKLLIISALLVVFVTPTFVSAEESTESGNKNRERINQIKENIREKKTEIREEVEENRADRREEFAKKHAERLTKRFEQYYERLTKIIAKIRVRISDNVEANAKLVEAEAKLNEAKRLGDEAIAMFEALDFGNLGSNKEEVEIAKNKAIEARNAFSDSMKLAKDTVQLAKENNKNEEDR